MTEKPLHPHLAALEAFRLALAADVAPPTDGELRDYARGFEDPVLDLWALGDVTELAERIRHAGVVHARLRGTKVKNLAEHLEVDERTVLRQYPLPRIQIRTVPEQDPLELYERRTGATAAQPLLLQLDLEDGELSVFPFPDVTPDQRPERVDTGVLVRWELPLLTPAGANTLMRQAKPLAQRMRFGAALAQDKTGRVHVGLDADAAQARREIDQLCDSHVQGPHYLVETEAIEVFGSSAQRVAAEAGLTAAATPAQIQAAAQAAEQQALDGGLILLGAAEHLEQGVRALGVDTELVLAVLEGPYTGNGNVAEYGFLEHLLGENTEVTAWVSDQLPLLEENSERWIAATFDPLSSPLPVQVFDLDEDTAIALARELDQHTPPHP